MEGATQASFGSVLKRYRITAGLSQEALAERAGLTARAIMYLERGARYPYPATILQLAQALQLTLQEKAALVGAAQQQSDAQEASAVASLPAGAESDPPPRNPYKGLRAFTGDDAGDFFGREDLVGSLLSVIGAATDDAARFLAVVGPSGSGKSSLVLAGLLPRLRHGALPGSETWIYLDPLAPGAHPLESLAVTLGNAFPGSSLKTIGDDLHDSARGLHLLAARLARHPGVRVVLVVDQCEELFTLAADEGERQAFIDLLVTAVTEPRGALQAILTLRADFYDRPMRYPVLGRLMEAYGKSVLPMEPADLRRAIEQPAAQQDVGLRFEGELVSVLLFELHGQVGALPLLQFTLDQLFERREGRLLTMEAYRELGGMRGALARHAEATFAILPSEEHRRLGRALFLRLIDPGAIEQDTTRRRAAMSELALPDPAHTITMLAVADAFIDARLLTITERAGVTTIEVSHEALIREWARLAGWLHEARDDIRLQQAISGDTAEWARRGHPPDRLYRGSPLDEALAWAERNTPSRAEQEFLAAGLRERQRQEAAARERQARELALARQAAVANRRAAHRLRYLAVVLVVFLMVAAGLTVFAVNKALTANTNAVRATAAQAAALMVRDLATSRQLAAQAINHLGDQYDLALLLSLEANRIAATAEARDSLLRALQSNPRLLTFLHGHTGSVTSLAFSHAGAVLASASVDGTIRLWDTSSRRSRGVLRTLPPVTFNSVAFSPDGAMLASGADDGTLQLWSVATGQPLGVPFPDQADSVKNLAFSPDGTLLATVSGDGEIRLWNVRARQLLGLPFGDNGGFVTCLSFSPDGRLLATGSTDGTIRLRDVARRQVIGVPLRGHSDAVTSLAFSPDGTMLVSGSADRTVRLWKAPGGQPIGAPLRGHTAGVTSVVFSPDGRTLASGSQDHTVQLWDVTTGQPLGLPLRSHSDAVNSVAFSPDGRMLASGGVDATIRLWDLAGARALSSVLRGHTGAVSSVAFNPDGQLLVSGSQDKTARIWDVARRSPFGPPSPLQTMGVNGARFSSMGAIVATGDDSGVTQLWSMAHPGTLWTPLGPPLPNPGFNVESLSFSPDGTLLAAGTQNNTIVLWNAVSRQQYGQPLTGHTDVVIAVAFSPDGKTLASASQDKTLRLWDVASGQELGAPLTDHTDSVDSVAFSPDGRLLASGSADRTIRLWNVAARQPYGAPLIGHTDTVTGLAFSQDGKTLASSSIDGTVRLWDVATGQAIGVPLTGHAGNVTSVAFSPDGQLLASGGADHTVRVWDVGLASWARRACAIANRNLTPREWEQYLIGFPYRRVCM